MPQMNFTNFMNEEAPPIVNSSEPHMACLFLLDTSGSMGCELDDGIVPIDALNDAINRFKSEVCADDKTADILDVAIVEFNNSVNVLQDFSPVEYMQKVDLVAHGGTYMVPAIETAIDMISERSKFYRRMGTEPYKPWIILISDGAPMDNISKVSERVNSLVQSNKLAFWSLSLPGADNSILHQLSGRRVLNLVGYDFTGFFDWVNKSMRAVSESAPGEKVKGQELPPSMNIDDLM